ncbi:MAG: nitrile hydratase subunit beta [Rhodospirillales bacterium]|nr:nitrile hydratase subunit beta [Rhodospirillales bacterium]MDP6644192.1 nitrile hydratase subunit beta [Rhodospirillales bacterium]MDP6842036.1 nitrile hydratase subunit beta [Rhodospirillales bacterium]
MRKLLQVPTLSMPRRQGGAAQPGDVGGPVFEEPWQAHGFAIVMSLYQDGKYSWAEWDDYLGHEIQSPGHFGAPGDVPGDAAAEDEPEDAANQVPANYNRWIASCEEDGAKYYHHWLAAAEKLLDAKGIVGKAELDARVAAFAKAERDGPRFKAGERVVVARDVPLAGHTHLPLYLRGNEGAVERDLGLFHFPEAGDGGDAEIDTLQHVYSIRFQARDIWGADASATHSLNFNLWDYNLDAA